jgi:uncharacterized protein
MENSKLLTNFIIGVTVLLVALFLIKTFDISYPITLTSTTKSTELAVVGEGKVDVVPDTGYIDLGVTVNDALTTEAAQQTVDQTNNKIIEALQKIGVTKADIKTTNYSINPNYSYDNGKNNITGYNGNATLEVKTKDPQMASKIIDEATKAGANQIQGSRFVIDSPEKYREAARNNAIQNARDQAQKLASSLGIKLGRVTNIVESSPETPQPIYGVMKAVGMGGARDTAAPSIEPGTQTITSVVTLYFEKR